MATLSWINGSTRPASTRMPVVWKCTCGRNRIRSLPFLVLNFPWNSHKGKLSGQRAAISMLPGSLFETEGFAVEISADGKAALEAFRATTPAVIVLDLRLPSMSGRDVCREIKQQSPAVPIIVLSAASDVSDKVLLLELGADDYVK